MARDPKKVWESGRTIYEDVDGDVEDDNVEDDNVEVDAEKDDNGD